MGLERTFYNVSEDVGVVEVCAIVYSPTIVCPIAFPFDVSLSTSDNTAGIFLLNVIQFQCFIVCELSIHVYTRQNKYLLTYSQRNPWTTLDSQGS